MKAFEILSVFTYAISKLIPKKKNRWIFGAWFGTAVSDNTKALYDYVARNHPEIERIWVASDPDQVDLPGCRVVRRNSLGSLRYILTARVAVMNQGFGDFAAFNLLGGALKVQLWHGVAWKKIGRDAYPELSPVHSWVFNLINRYDLYIAPSEEYGKRLAGAFGAGEGQILLCGQPRNQSLFDPDFCARSHQHILDAVGEHDKKILVYMPTFRDKTDEVFSFCEPSAAERFGTLASENGYIIVEKSHFKSANQSSASLEERHIYRLPHEDAQVLLGAADVLVTDYSSCFFDFMIRNRPIVHFLYDFEYYKSKDRGVYYENAADVTCGSVACTQEELCQAIAENLNADPERDRREVMRAKFITYESPENCSRIMQEIRQRLG